ncbi:Pre-mRNA-splicing factor of RES complex-domain-containing protein [Hysterangium stoloniferum]|nr:Pre-mRNA-splicing factor of RES complex-domain-containing protein [Hysterangium stoloniferum]
MQAYLAEKYMSGPKADAILARAASHKKKKRKADDADVSLGYAVRDEDGGWGVAAPDEGEEVAAPVVASDRSFKKRKAGEGWETIRKADDEPPPADEQPLVVETEEAPMAGLLTAEQMKKKFGKQVVEVEEPDPSQLETVYRDASGRKIDTKAAKAEAARLKREREEREAKKMEWGKGLVQRDEQERRKAELEKEKTRGLARYANDKDLNEEQKMQERWNDPAAAFLSVNAVDDISMTASYSSKKTSKGPRKPTYNGPPPPPNRFGIKPGYRWDGVDRSNGFEKKLFQSLNSRKRTGHEAHQWSVEDM